MSRFAVPLGVFAVLVAFLYVGLGLNPREVPSPLIGKATPAFSLPDLAQPDRRFGPDALRGQVWLLNVWASWCVSCRQEHGLLVELGKQKLVPIYGLNYKDRPEEAARWLRELGDPYDASVMDRDGRVGIDLGVYGVPETFVIDRYGMIRYKQIGPLTREILEKKILPLVRELSA